MSRVNGQRMSIFPVCAVDDLAFHGITEYEGLKEIGRAPLPS